MASVNKVILIGHLGSDPEVRYLPNGDAVANVGLATSYAWTDKSGEKQEKTEWHRIIAFGRLGEIFGEYLKKGAQIYIEGRLQTRKWQDKDGNDRYTTEIVCEQMRMLGKRDDGGAREDRPSEAPAARGKPAPQEKPSAKKTAGRFEDMEDDIPF